MTDWQLYQKKVWDDPDWFLTEVLGITPWSKQQEIVQSVKDNKRTLCYSCVSSGKTFIGAALIPWWLSAFYPARVFGIAPTERQLDNNLFGQFKTIHRNSKMLLGGDPKYLGWKVADDLYAQGFAPQGAMNTFGQHGPHDLYLIDDGQGIDLDVLDTIENAFAGGNTRLLMLCNPLMTAGRVYDAIHGVNKFFHCIQIRAQDTPNVQAGRIVVPGLITKEQVDEWVDEYGEDSNFVKVKVLAETPGAEGNSVFPLAWIEAAMNRDVPVTNDTILGCDIGEFGDDSSVIATLKGRAVQPLQVMHGNELTVTTGWIVLNRKETNARHIYVDAIGIGAGVASRLRELKEPVTGVISSESAEDIKYLNKRTEMAFLVRGALNPANPIAISLPKDLDLQAELASIKYTLHSSGKLMLEPKKEVRKRLKRSPDRADAVCLAVYKAYSAAEQRPFIGFAQTFGEGTPNQQRIRPDWLPKL